MNYFSKTLLGLIWISFLSFQPLSLFSQSFSSSGSVNIPSSGNISVPVSVTGLQGAINTSGFGLQSATINIANNDVSKLQVELQSPDGNKILLAKGLPGKNLNATFNGTANIYIDFGSAPYNNSYRPLNDLGLLNNGQDPNSTWNLNVISSGSSGKVNSVSLTFGSQPAVPLLTSSNLPIVIINTNGQTIVDDPKIVADMKIIYNGPGQMNYTNSTNYDYSGKMGIEFRGHSSQQFPKKQYGFTTYANDGVNDSNVSILGMPEESDWILSANYSDKSLMRNVLTYELSREMGNYASRTRYCEVIINNEYKGVFVLQEKIKRDKGRVDVKKLKTTDITDPNVTGGYIFSIDKLDGGEITWLSNYKAKGKNITFQFVYPKNAEDLASQQETYLKNYVKSFEDALYGSNFSDPVNGFRKYADEHTFMDFFMINELSRNVDGYRLSSYFYKDRGGKLMAGPVWDYDIAYGNADYFNGVSYLGFEYQNSDISSSDNNQIPFWWSKFMSDPAWVSAMKQRYSVFRSNILSNTRINAIIDSLNNELNVQNAQQRNFIRWNILGKYVWPNTAWPSTYAAEVTNLKTWISNRLTFLDGQLLVPLPVQLLSFSCSKKENRVILNWSTAQELNLASFEIERSANNLDFREIGMVNSKGNSPTGFEYTFEDQSPSTGTNFYRLIQVDLDGQSKYSNVISVNLKSSGQWRISPTIASDQLNIISPLNGNEFLQIKIFNIQGQQLKSQNILNSPVIKFNVGDLPGGNYIVSIEDTKRNHTSLKFVKK